MAGYEAPNSLLLANLQYNNPLWYIGRLFHARVYSYCCCDNALEDVRVMKLLKRLESKFAKIFSYKHLSI